MIVSVAPGLSPGGDHSPFIRCWQPRKEVGRRAHQITQAEREATVLPQRPPGVSRAANRATSELLQLVHDGTVRLPVSHRVAVLHGERQQLQQAKVLAVVTRGLEVSFHQDINYYDTLGTNGRSPAHLGAARRVSVSRLAVFAGLHDLLRDRADPG